MHQTGRTKVGAKARQSNLWKKHKKAKKRASRKRKGKYVINGISGNERIGEDRGKAVRGRENQWSQKWSALRIQYWR